MFARPPASCLLTSAWLRTIVVRGELALIPGCHELVLLWHAGRGMFTLPPAGNIVLKVPYVYVRVCSG